MIKIEDPVELKKKSKSNNKVMPQSSSAVHLETAESQEGLYSTNSMNQNKSPVSIYSIKKRLQKDEQTLRSKGNIEIMQNTYGSDRSARKSSTPIEKEKKVKFAYK